MPINTKKNKGGDGCCENGHGELLASVVRLIRELSARNDGPTEAAGPLHWVCLPQPYKRTTLRGCCSII